MLNSPRYKIYALNENYVDLVFKFRSRDSRICKSFITIKSDLTKFGVPVHPLEIPGINHFHYMNNRIVIELESSMTLKMTTIELAGGKWIELNI